MEAVEIKYYEKMLDYVTIMGYDVDDDNYLFLFPGNWSNSSNFELKTRILDEAIEKKCLVVDTELYAGTMMERVYN